jgi:AcrR family transcriptional regulator
MPPAPFLRRVTYPEFVLAGAMVSTTRQTSGRRVGRPPGPSPDPAARREELLDAAERVIAAEGPDVSMSAIAAEIGLTKPVVYRSLGDKAELSTAVGQRVADRLGRQLRETLTGPGDLRDVAAGAIDVFCRFVDEETNLYRFIVHGSIGTRHTGLSDKPLVSRMGGELSDTLALGLAEAGADVGRAPTWAYALLGAVFAATEHWLRHRHVTRAELVDQLVDLILPGLTNARLTTADDPLPRTSSSTPEP